MAQHRRVRAILRHPLETILCVLLVSLVVVTFAQVVTRYVLYFSLSWSEELARYLLMWLSMLSAAYGFKMKAHFSIVFIMNRFPASVRPVMSIVVSILVCVFLSVFVVKSAEITYMVRDQVGPATGFSKAIPYSSAVVGGVLMLYYIVRNTWHEWRGRDTDGSSGHSEGAEWESSSR